MIEVMNKRKVIRVLALMIVCILVATVIAYFICRPANEWLAFYVACSGGVLIVNLILSIVFISHSR
jgi:zinc transporter ZupT